MNRQRSATQLRWAVLGTGHAARAFVAGLRATSSGQAVAVASGSTERAERFAREFHIAQAVTGHLEAVALPDIDAVYVATPPAAHLEHAVTSLSLGLPTLVEKPFAVDAEEAVTIARTARREGVFCMEAMWTRFLPAVRRAKALVACGALGEIEGLEAGFHIRRGFRAGSHHLDPGAGGGALLDRGVYPISLAVHLLGHVDQPLGSARFGPTGVDEHVAGVLRHDRGALALVSAGFRTAGRNDLLVMGTEAVLHLEAPLYRPSLLRFTPVAEQGPARSGWRTRLAESDLARQVGQRIGLSRRPPRGVGEVLAYAGNGYGHQTDEVYRCLSAGLLESPVMSLDESVHVVEVADALRASWTQRMEVGG